MPLAAGRIPSVHLVLLLFTAAILSGCGASSRLRSLHGNKYRYSVSMVSPVASDAMLYRDERIMIQFRFDDPAIRFQVQNLTTGTMQIDWPGVSLEIDGARSAVRTMSTLYDTTGIIRPGPVIQSFEVMRDIVLPAGNAALSGRKWLMQDLLPTTDGNEAERAVAIRSSVGKKIELVLPVRSGAGLHTYRFAFLVDSVQQISWSDYRAPAWIPPSPQLAKLKQSTEDKITTAVIVGGFAGIFRYFVAIKKSPVVE